MRSASDSADSAFITKEEFHRENEVTRSFIRINTQPMLGSLAASLATLETNVTGEIRKLDGRVTGEIQKLDGRVTRQDDSIKDLKSSLDFSQQLSIAVPSLVTLISVNSQQNILTTIVIVFLLVWIILNTVSFVIKTYFKKG